MLVNNEKGQSIFEFVVFVPFLIMIYTMIITISNALNASINQQKITRAYFYYLKQNDSHFPSPSRGNSSDPINNLTFSSFSMSIIGWADEFEGQSPIAPCFEIKLPVEDLDADVCRDAYSAGQTKFIRVGTVYGVCGGSYVQADGGVGLLPMTGLGPAESVADQIGACSLIE